jgi:hypothetical protein
MCAYRAEVVALFTESPYTSMHWNCYRNAHTAHIKAGVIWEIVNKEQIFRVANLSKILNSKKVKGKIDPIVCSKK